jgi:hypothetical protein
MRNNIRFLIIQEMLNSTNKKLLKEGFGDALKSWLRSAEKIGSKALGDTANTAFTKALRQNAELAADEVQALQRAFVVAGLDETMVVAKTTAESIKRIQDALSLKIYNDTFGALGEEQKAVLRSAMAGGLEKVAELISNTEASVVKGAVKAAVTSDKVKGVAEQFARDNSALLKTGKVFTQEDLMAQAKSIARELYGKEIPDAVANETYLKAKGILENVLADKKFLDTIDAIPKKPGYSRVIYDSFMSKIAPYLGKGAAWTVAAVLAVSTFIGVVSWLGSVVVNKFCNSFPTFCPDSSSQGGQAQGGQVQGGQAQGGRSRGPNLKGRSASGKQEPPKGASGLGSDDK